VLDWFRFIALNCHPARAGVDHGQTEGQITKLKLVKQMYGRGKRDLLQARMLAAN
jgi:transposase